MLTVEQAVVEDADESVNESQKKEKLLIDSRKSFDSTLPLFIATVSNINNIITNKLN